MSEASKSANKNDNVPYPATAVQQYAAVNVDPKRVKLTLVSEDVKLLNKSSNSYYERVYITHVTALWIGYVAGRYGLIPGKFLHTHPIVYVSMIFTSQMAQKYLCNNYTKTLEEAFVNSELKTPFSQFVRQHGWPELYNQNAVNFILTESDPSEKKSFWKRLISKVSKQTDNENKS